MKFFQKTWVAWLLTAVMIVAAIGIGLTKTAQRAPEPAPSASTGLDTGLSTQKVQKFLWDGADLLSAAAEGQLNLYNANWDYRYNSVVALVTTPDPVSDLDFFAQNQGLDMGLGEGDAILAISSHDWSYTLFYGSDFSTILTNRVISDLDGILARQIDESSLLSFYAALNEVYQSNFGLGNAEPSPFPGYSSGGSRVSAVILLVVILIIMVAVISALDRMRYDAYRRQYYGVPTPPVIFRPILFWHGPGTSWYRRRWRQPPPPPPPRGPGARTGQPPWGRLWRGQLLRLRRPGQFRPQRRRHLWRTSLRRGAARQLWGHLPGRLLWGRFQG